MTILWPALLVPQKLDHEPANNPAAQSSAVQTIDKEETSTSASPPSTGCFQSGCSIVPTIESRRQLSISTGNLERSHNAPMVLSVRLKRDLFLLLPTGLSPSGFPRTAFESPRFPDGIQAVHSRNPYPAWSR